MKTFENLMCQGMELLSDSELQDCNGGGFAYDTGFLLREFWVFVSNGGSVSGSSAVAVDVGVNYRPR